MLKNRADPVNQSFDIDPVLDPQQGFVREALEETAFEKSPKHLRDFLMLQDLNQTIQES